MNQEITYTLFKILDTNPNLIQRQMAGKMMKFDMTKQQVEELKPSTQHFGCLPW